ncbi:ankyrin repeat and KH domain-containing protein 1 [Biomphalaria pfeifferi]|uniref:Ankyrin repeat and KH domain-containing protein 1 n=1 Tax=Biomphalaria pfeifferi TaxID=112525 RepID=A0AAD8BBJ0_BIOPF|nr:ankyrin repeat and KH domain-containing protein 1 [Biomphalaria pfeifferi]
MGADINAKNNNGDTALMLATSRKVIQCLLNDRSLHLDERNSTGNTTLMSAIETSHLQKVKLLISAGASPHRRVGEFLQNGSISWSGPDESAFDLAERMGFGQLLKLLYRAKMVNLNPLKLAAVDNDFESCITLLKYKLCQKNDTQNHRPNILCYVLKQIQQRDAIPSSDIEFVRELCRLGMDVNSCQYCTNSRMELVLNIGSYDMAEILCAHGAKVTYKGSALDVALENSLTGTASLLFNHGAAFDSEYAFSKALQSNNAKMLNFLMKCAESKDLAKKQEAFIRAVKLGDIQNIQILLDAGQDINRVHDNKTPSMSAVHKEVINFLLNNGADVILKTNTTPLINAIS